MHAPQEVPKQYSDLYPSPKYSPDYAIMNGMASIADEAFGNVTAALKAKGMWENTLIAYTSDNGGPAGQASSGHSGNNWPLRGGKTNNFEGGVRVVSFISGGFVPARVRGTSLDGYMHGADWYPTMLGLAGVSEKDPAGKDPAGRSIPDIDGIDMWGYLTNTSGGGVSPRTEIVLSTEEDKTGGGGGGAMISGDYKLVTGWQTYGFWTAPRYPNVTTDHKAEKPFDCGQGCVFDIRSDPSEYRDLSKSQPALFSALLALFKTRKATQWEAVKIPTDPSKCEVYRGQHGGFLGPYYGATNTGASYNTVNEDLF
jgi:arylsulfatase A-like enzyme